uniref:Uncharacterized protein n=1 Tax=Acrobeloides nanus TaxID=290746 RepID=A0A914DIG7_9BILA
MAPSKVKPTNAHSVRPADINLVMAMGDSLTAGMGAASYNFSDWGEFRGLSFGAGGDKVVVAYQQVVKEIEQNGTFDSTEDFTVVTQPFYTNATLPANETVYRKFWAPDCYHYSQYGHALISSWFWQNMLQPVGSKLATANLNSPSLPLACPDAVKN